VLDWFRACLRNGWLGSHKRRNKNVPTPYRDGDYLAATLQARDRYALAMPYGEKAFDLGLTDDPSSTRPDVQDGAQEEGLQGAATGDGHVRRAASMAAN
jgi:hypothetical protein